MKLKPVLGPVQLIFYSVGVIVGAGVYSVIGTAAGVAQHSLWLSFLISAGVALLTAISYAEMTTSFPAAGAEYVYIRRAWPKADWLALALAQSSCSAGPRRQQQSPLHSAGTCGCSSICPRHCPPSSCWRGAPR